MRTLIYCDRKGKITRTVHSVVKGNRESWITTVRYGSRRVSWKSTDPKKVNAWMMMED